MAGFREKKPSGSLHKLGLVPELVVKCSYLLYKSGVALSDHAQTRSTRAWAYPLMNTMANTQTMMPTISKPGTAYVRTRLRDRLGDVHQPSSAPANARTGVAHTMCCDWQSEIGKHQCELHVTVRRARENKLENSDGNIELNNNKHAATQSYPFE